MADSIHECSPDSPDIPDSGCDGGPSLNLINTESVADLEGFQSLNILDGVPQVEKHRNYTLRITPIQMADNLQESSPDDDEIESDYDVFEGAKTAPKINKSKKQSNVVHSDTRFPIKEGVGGKRPNYKLKGNVGYAHNDESESEDEESEIVKFAPKLKNSKTN